ncbi:MAG: ABC transporter ATP-binding protein [Desulfomonilaceae bacterium]
MLMVDDVHTFLGRSYVIQGTSLRVDEGQIVSLLGRNGVGKTTLIRSIMGLVPISQGRIVLQDEDFTTLKPYTRAKKGLGLVPQGRQIFPSLTVLENLQINTRMSREGQGSRWNLQTVLELFPRLKARLSNRGDQLSGGEQQMLAIGRALAGNPVFLLMDEPSEGLAPIVVREIADLVTRLKAQGLSILLVEQNFKLAVGVADRVYIMSKGKIVYESAPAELVENRVIQEKFLGI